MDEADAKRIARGSFRNRGQIMSASRCGCYYCLAIFDAGEIREWVDEGQTALCPRCSIDAVLAGVMDSTTLQWLHQVQFERAYRLDANGTKVRVR